MTSLLLTGIAELTTNDPVHDGTPHGIVHDAAVVLEGRRVAWVGRRADAPDADAARDLGGRAVLPGFVDSHSHLVFAGDRADEFAARMAGESYAAGGIRRTVAASNRSVLYFSTQWKRPSERSSYAESVTSNCPSSSGSSMYSSA